MFASKFFRNTNTHFERMVMEFKNTFGRDFNIYAMHCDTRLDLFFLFDIYSKLKENGEYKICFKNEFSTREEKSIFLSFEAGKTNRLLKQIEENDSEMKFVESSANEIHNFLEHVISFQTHFRLVI